MSRPWVFRGLVIALAIAVGATVYIAVRGGEEGEPAATRELAEARILSEEELADVASTSETPVYWAGEMEGAELEVTEEAAGRVLVRYLEERDEIGAAFGRRIAVGSYPLPDPRGALNTFAQTPGATVTRVDGIGKVVISPEAQRNVYFVDPMGEVQVEVFAPSSEEAIDLVRSGEVRPIG